MFKSKKNAISEQIENYFREIFEIKQAQSWFASAGFFAVTGGYQTLNHLLTNTNVPDSMLLTGLGTTISLGMGIKRSAEAWPIMKTQAKLCSNSLVIESLEQTRRRAMKYTKKGKMYLGTGYDWGPEHAVNMYAVNALPSARRQHQVPVFLRKFIPYNPKLNEELGGEPYLMALGDEQPVAPSKNIGRAHTLIVGLPGAGKTTLLKLMALNKLWSGEKVLLLIIDPKNTPELKNGLKEEMERQGKGDQFYYFAPARPSESVTIDPMSNYNRITELSTRVVECIPTGGSEGETFKNFCFERSNQIFQAANYIGQRLTLSTLYYYLREGIDRLCEQTCEKYFANHAGEDWKHSLQARINSQAGTSWLEKMVGYYVDVMAVDHPCSQLSGVIDAYRTSPAEVRKMTGSLNSILEQLCSSPLDTLLSPDLNDLADDKQRVVNIDEIANTGGVLYCATDGLTDPLIAGTISRLIAASTSAASAERYNYGTGDEPQVCFMIDEAHNALNDMILNLLAIGRQSKYELTLATQSLPDIVEKTSQATADRVTELCANTIALRCEGKITREYVSEKIGAADLAQYQKMISNSASTQDNIGSYNAGSGMRESTLERPLFPPFMVSALPNLQAICSFSNGSKTLLRLPVEPR
ncbi:conjugative transfer system coupling protein TraD [Vibrio sp. SCSIO 43140]|uniref:conjugative transfer system coupling protein TraD n=1 Tax=Vibrio sp. SCSIO 43140 TaxID=2819100 RepID=UPI00207566BE|nr:conjugative transfer system coupling protein TraD [Vibrio sp. SCSIO 43140]USD58928.1 conjugative transfer system coupling protein TraD [Vibrio sp. SCSIO 43140]